MSWITFPGLRSGHSAGNHDHVSTLKFIKQLAINSLKHPKYRDYAEFYCKFWRFLQSSQEHSVAGSDGGGNRNTRDINKNFMHAAELKKLNTRFYSEVLRKKFFVLYEDSRQSLTNPRDHTDHSDVSQN